MTIVLPHLTFKGNCFEAMTFYKECLGGELTIQRVSDTPMVEYIPANMRNYILHASLTKGSFRLMASDMVSEMGLTNGNTISLLLNCSSEKEIFGMFNCLSKGGAPSHPIEVNHWGGFSGDLIDKYGIQWMLYYQPE